MKPFFARTLRTAFLEGQGALVSRLTMEITIVYICIARLINIFTKST